MKIEFRHEFYKFDQLFKRQACTTEIVRKVFWTFERIDVQKRREIELAQAGLAAKLPAFLTGFKNYGLIGIS